MTVRVPMWRWFAPVPMLAGVALIALTCALGRWQLSRAHERIERQARIVALENAPAQRITAQPVTADSVTASWRWKMRPPNASLLNL